MSGTVPVELKQATFGFQNFAKQRLVGNLEGMSYSLKDSPAGRKSPMASVRIWGNSAQDRERRHKRDISAPQQDVKRS